MTHTSRRTFLYTSAGGLAALTLSRSAGATSTSATARPPIKAIAFDGLAVFDARPVAALAEQLFPGKGAELSAAWRVRQFEYTWLRTLSRRYADFLQVTDDALRFAAVQTGVELSGEKRDALLGAFFRLKAWPDVSAVLKSLRQSGVRLALLSNFTVPMLDAAVTNAGLDGVFEPHLSTDKVRAFKPDPRAYAMATDAFGLRADAIAFVAFGGWDAAGAKAFGFPTYWANRTGAPLEQLGDVPDATGKGLVELPAFISGR